MCLWDRVDVGMLLLLGFGCCWDRVCSVCVVGEFGIWIELFVTRIVIIRISFDLLIWLLVGC